MRVLPAISAALIGLMVCISAAQAADIKQAKIEDDYYRVCTDADLIGGTWKLLVLNETPKRKEAAYAKHIPYQYIAFFQRGEYSFVATNHEIKTPLQLQQAMLWPEKAQRTLTYTLDKEGILNLFMDKAETYSYRCVAVIKDKEEYKKGDLILRGFTAKSQTSVYKLYRRWP